MASNLNKAQQAQLESAGFLYQTVPVSAIPKRTFYTIDRHTGRLVTMPNLPADPRSLQYYLDKGFKLDPSELRATQTVVTPKVIQEGVKYTCKVCQRSFATQRAMAGHGNKHNKE